MKDEDLLDRARRHFKLVTESEADQRERERDDLEFQIPERQWTEDARRNREGDVHTPARPILSISKLDQPLQLLYNQAQNARLGIRISPVNEKAEKETAEVLQGIYRRIERDSSASQARLWAFDRSSKAGRGFYRVVTRYDEDASEPWDQEIGIERILHQDAVYLDPAATKPDWSDGEWAFVTAWMAEDDFKRKYPKAKLSVGGELQWKGAIQETPEWVRTQNNENAVLIAEYWYKEHQTEKLELEEGEYKRTREVDNVTVYCCKLTGNEMLEKPQKWDGTLIPIIPVLGRELQPVDGERYYNGMIGPARDGQRLYNVAASAMVERLGLEPKAPFIGAEGQFEGHEEEWKTANIKNWPYLEHRQVDLDGRPAPPPVRAVVENTGTSLAMMVLQQADQFVQGSTATFDPSLGRIGPSADKERSGRAILALQQQSEVGTSNYLSNLAQVAMRYEARIILELIPKVYDRPGRITQILDDEDEVSPVMLGMPYREDRDSGMPQMVDPRQPREPGVKFYDLAAGRYGIAVSVGKSRQTRLAEGSEMLGELLKAQPHLSPLFLPVFLQFQDWPGAQEAAKLAKKYREKTMPGIDSDDDGQPTVEQLQGQVQQMQQAGQALQQQLQQAHQEIQTQQARQQAVIQKAQIDAQTKMGLAQQDSEAKLKIAVLEQQFAQMQAEMKATAEMRRQDDAQAHEDQQQASDQEHEDQSQAAAEDHDVEMAVLESRIKPISGKKE